MPLVVKLKVILPASTSVPSRLHFLLKSGALPSYLLRRNVYCLRGPKKDVFIKTLKHI